MNRLNAERSEIRASKCALENFETRSRLIACRDNRALVGSYLRFECRPSIFAGARLRPACNEEKRCEEKRCDALHFFTDADALGATDAEDFGATESDALGATEVEG